MNFKKHIVFATCPADQGRWALHHCWQQFSLLPFLRGVGIALLVGLLPLAVVFAHANLVSSDPADGAGLTNSPPLITLQFSENLDASFSSVNLLDSKGQVIVPGPGTISLSSPRTMTLKLPPLPDGVYSRGWPCDQRWGQFFGWKGHPARLALTAARRA